MSHAPEHQPQVVEHASRPLAVVVCGAPGSGKSTVGALVARRMRAALLDLDVATSSLTAVIARLHGTDDLDDRELAALTRSARYDSITALAVDNLEVGTSAVLVAPFTLERRDQETWAVLRRRLRDAGGDAEMVWLRLPPDEARRRIEQRGAERDMVKRRRDPTAGLDLDPPAVPHLAVDALPSPAVVAETVLAALSGGRP